MMNTNENTYQVKFALNIREDTAQKSFTINPDFESYNTEPLQYLTIKTTPPNYSRMKKNFKLEVLLQLHRERRDDEPSKALREIGDILSRIVDSVDMKLIPNIALDLFKFGDVTLWNDIQLHSSGTPIEEGRDANPENEIPELDQRSGTVPASLDKIRNPVTLQRSTRPLTGDVALWLMIKMNAKNLGWDNYQAHLELLFGPDEGKKTNIYYDAQRLSRRRFLPFTDTDAYRTLKVATEAFVVSWGGVVPTNLEGGQILTAIAQDDTAIQIARDRLGIDISKDVVEKTIKQYFDGTSPPTIPYLTRVIQGLRGTDAEKYADEALQDSANAQISGDKPCGETCLWLTPLNSDLSTKLSLPPFTELIWSYWMEEMQLVQTMNAISRRFQNISSGPHDPLTPFELDPVRRLNNLIWSHVQDEQHRLPIERRAAEYQHEYGLRLFGRAIPSTRAADVRSKFLAAFHTLLNQCVPYFRQADDTTVVPDAFPLLNALREVHLVLSEGAHNQFLDLPNTARIEMMMQQWILARPEFREFLPRRAMIAYPEPWMHSVESMRKLQGWGDTSTFQFWQLATTGEQIVSSIRWGDWNSITDATNAANWAAFFRPEIQTYIHSYRAVTGIDVSAEPVDVQVPGMHLLRRLQEQQRSRVGSRSMAP